MAEKVTLPSGATATLRDPQELRVKDRTKIYANANNTEGIMQAISLTDGLIAALVVEWSYDLIPPSIKIDSLGELTMADYDTLALHASKAQDVIFPNLNKTPETEADPKADTANSND
ncbi:MAG: hypothetical protein EBS18_02810 [Actinobacteria bacterium]|nr:hypothetical protein [Actinomycetota bacterium]